MATNQTTDTLDRLYSLRQLSAVTGVSVSQFMNLIRRGDLTAINFGSRDRKMYKVSTAEFERFMKDNASEPEPAEESPKPQPKPNAAKAAGKPKRRAK